MQKKAHHVTTAMRFLCRLVMFCAVFLCQPLPEANADNWRATLYNEGLPPRIVAVDKERKTFLYFEKKSPLKLKYSFPCVTGQVAGDKQALNDLRTPEGVYFVEYKIASGLDFKEYGGIAYTLNYPNPVDRLRGKTGHGIWIHSKGYGLVPTRGCVAIGLDHIDQVGPNLLPGTAVVVAEHMDESRMPVKDNGTAHELRRLMQSWSEAWAARSKKMFDFYDAEAYSKATENFAAFRANKERLFKMLQFIKLYNREIHAMEGPGYWVTWAEQYYTASNLSTEGIRRLYWQRGKDRKFRIVGMEWAPRDVGMRADYQKGKLVAQAGLTVATDAASEAPVLPRLDMPETPDIPETPTLKPDPVSVAEAPVAIAAQQLAMNEAVAPAQEAPKPQVSREEMAQQVAQAAQGFDDALANRSNAIEGLFDKARYQRSRGLPQGPSFSQQWRELQRLLRQPWVQVINRPITVDWQGDFALSRSEQLIVAPDTVLQGVRTLWWQRDAHGAFRIVRMEFAPQELGLAADYLDMVSGPIGQVLEAWRKAWESANVQAYGAFYTDTALQQTRRGAQAIMQHKNELWPRVSPTRVELTGLRLMLDKKGVRADMEQTYTNSSGHTDKGIKTLWFDYNGENWRIAREDWAAR